MRNAEAIDQMDARFNFATDDTDPSVESLKASQARTMRDTWATKESLILVQRLFAVQGTETPRVVLFADVDEAENSGRMAASVAETLASTSSRATCLVDADLRTPALSRMLGLANAEGLTEALSSDAPIRSFMRGTGHSHMSFLAAGSAHTGSASLLASERFQERLEELRKTFDYVIVNAAPLSTYADAIAMGQLTNGLVLTLKAGATRREAAQIAATNLREAKVPILGAVLMDRTFPIPEKLYKKL